VVWATAAEWAEVVEGWATAEVWAEGAAWDMAAGCLMVLGCPVEVCHPGEDAVFRGRQAVGVLRSFRGIPARAVLLNLVPVDLEGIRSVSHPPIQDHRPLEGWTLAPAKVFLDKACNEAAWIINGQDPLPERMWESDGLTSGGLELTTDMGVSQGAESIQDGTTEVSFRERIEGHPVSRGGVKGVRAQVRGLSLAEARGIIRMVDTPGMVLDVVLTMESDQILPGTMVDGITQTGDGATHPRAGETTGLITAWGRTIITGIAGPGLATGGQAGTLRFTGVDTGGG
jgi:hypothetical protein